MAITEEEIKNIRKYVLINATEHKGIAQPKSVLGKMLADSPELRERVLEIKGEIEIVTDSVNRLSPAEQKKELDNLGGYKKEQKVEKKVLPDLEVKREGLVVRFAPNPDGALHLGNARPAVLCSEYAKKYNGKLILRFDDTDPKIKVPEKRYYNWIKEDLRWLKIKWHKEVIASKQFKTYYKYAEMLIKDSHAYVCTCSEEWKKLRDQNKSCPCRHLDAKTNMRRWKKMFTEYKEGQAVLRIKTDLEAKNPAVRDWPAFRIVDNPKHPLVKKKVWPLYNFASAIDDHIYKVTHIMRGQEHSTNEAKQRYVYQYFGWTYPFTIILGRFSVSDMVLSKSEIREGIAEGKFAGWDDPRLGTLRSLKRRGFTPEAIKQIIIDIGLKPSDITISMENLAAYNRKLIDKKANRYFFIRNPKKIEIKDLKLKRAQLALHPDVKKGYRTFSLGKYFFVDSEDFEKYRGVEVRFKDLCNVKLGDISKFTGLEVKSVPKIQWLPSKFIQVRVMMPGGVIKGYGETNLTKTKPDEVIQFERFGFVRIEKVSKTMIVAVFGHM